MALDLEEELRRLVDAEAVLASDVAEALRVLDAGGIDCALVDYTLVDGTSEALAERLVAAEIPFAWISGRVPPVEGDAPLIEKPFSSEELASVVQRLLETTRREAG